VEKPKKSRRKKLILWLGIDLTVAAIVILLLHHAPARYRPATPPPDDPNGRRVHPYISHELMPTLYNNSQDRKPFEIEVDEESLNEAIAQARWREESGGIRLFSPAIAFAPGRVVLMATADIEGADFVGTVEIHPQILDDGRLNLIVESVKIGIIPITWAAKKLLWKVPGTRGGRRKSTWKNGARGSLRPLLTEESLEPVLPLDTNGSASQHRHRSSRQAATSRPGS
jgi:hypothetical protein